MARQNKALGIDFIEWKNHSLFSRTLIITCDHWFIRLYWTGKNGGTCFWSVYAIVCDLCDSLRVKRSSCATTTLVNWPYIAHKYHLLTSSSVCTLFFRVVHVHSFQKIFVPSFCCYYFEHSSGIWFCIRLLIFKMNYSDCFDWTKQTHS